ncbi:MAG: WYL domain-containing protein [Alphaproteobacteria bacterium]
MPVVAMEKTPAPAIVLEPLQGLVHRRARASGPPQIASFRPSIVDASDSGELTEGTRTKVQVAADVRGVTIGIQYGNAEGRNSSRRITIIDLYRAEDGTAYLRSHCHEVGETRTFRFDRIKRVFDLDGVTYEPYAFFRDQLRVRIESVERRRGPLNFDPGAAQKKEAVGGARLLAALARSDGIMRAAEVDAIVDYMEQKSARLGIYTTEEDREALTARVKRMRPTQAMLGSCLRDLEQADMAEKQLFLRSAIAVVRADGKVAEDEVRLLIGLGQKLGCDIQRLL